MSIPFSFQTPTQVDPKQAASAVRGHEQEHVVREQAKAQRENRSSGFGKLRTWETGW